MKKLCLLLAAAMLAATFAACGASSSAPASSAVSSSGVAHVDGTLEELMEKVYEGIAEDEMPMVGNTELTADNSVYYTGVESTEYTEGLASEAMIGSIAHSVVLLRAEDEAAAETLKEDVKANVDPRKWICVEAEEFITDNIGDLVILIMSDGTLAPKLHENFLALAQ